MTNRYSRLFTLPSALYATGSPVVIVAGALLKDNQTGKVLGQLKLRSISPKHIKAVKVCITTMDTAARILGEPIEYQYLDLSVPRNTEFGQKTAISLPDAATRSFTVSVTEVVFSDNTIWQSSCNAHWKTLPNPVSLMAEIQDEELVKQYQLTYGKQCRFSPLSYEDLWFCSCGAVNHEGEASCHACHLEHARLVAVQWAALKEACNVRLAEERAYAERQETERARKEAEARVEAEKQRIAAAKKTKKNIILCASLAIIVIAGVFVMSQYILPAQKLKTAYAEAQTLFENGNYTEAFNAFTALGDYEDSAAKAIAAKEAQMKEQPQQENEAPDTSEPANPEAPDVPSVPVEPTPKVYKTYIPSHASSLNLLNNADSSSATPASYVTSQMWRMYPSENGTNYIWIDDLAVGDPIKIDDYNWQIKLREGATFQDGTPITADTWLYTFKQQLDPQQQNRMAPFLYDNAITIRNGEAYFLQGYWGYPSYVAWEDVGLKKIDDYTLQITTVNKHTDPNDIKKHFDSRNHTPIHPEMWDKCMSANGLTTSYGSDMTTFIGSGPYIFTEWQANSIQIYEKREDHWLADKFNFETVEVRLVPGTNARVEMFEAGEIYTLSPDPDTITRYIEDPRMVSYGSTSVTHIDVNSKNPNNPISSSVNYRKALYHAIDREYAAENIFGHMQPTGTYINNQAGLLSESGLTYRESAYGMAVSKMVESWGPFGYNPELALQYLNEALSECNVPDAKLPITIKYCVEYGDSDWLDFGKYLQEQWDTIFEGKLKLEVITYSGMTISEFKKSGNSKWDLAPNLWSRGVSRTYPHAAFYYYLSSYNGRPNNYTNADFDAQYAVCENLISGSYDTLLKETQKLEELYLEEVIHIPVYQESNYVLFADQLILPVRTYIPGFGWGEIYGDWAE